MHVAALGIAVLKGAAQEHPSSLALTRSGPVGDRELCCVDVAGGRVLRTVENPGLLRLRARRDGDRLRLEVPGTPVLVGPLDLTDELEADYWGRRARLRLLTGPWSAALSAHLGRDVALARAQPRDVVYGGGVTLVTTSTLRELATRAGRSTAVPDLLRDAERWRATAVVDTGDAPAFVEDDWLGGIVRLGPTPLRVGIAVPRCAVVRLRPRDGTREDWDPLALLAPDRRVGGEIVLGVDAEVGHPGTVSVGDPVLVGA